MTYRLMSCHLGILGVIYDRVELLLRYNPVTDDQRRIMLVMR